MLYKTFNHKSPQIQTHSPTHLTNIKTTSRLPWQWHNDVERDRYRFHAVNLKFLSVMQFAKLLFRTFMNNTTFALLWYVPNMYNAHPTIESNLENVSG